MKGLVGLVLLAVACGGKTPGPTGPATPDPPSGGGGGSGAAVSAVVTEPECDQLLDHTLTIAIAERPADQRIDEAEQTKLRGDVRDAFVTRCRSMPRATYSCAIAAQTTAAMEACEPQASRSSSTSNSSVAPGGMTPAAPRSP